MKNSIIQQLIAYKKEQGEHPLLNLKISLHNIELLPLLKGQQHTTNLFPIIYWQDKDAMQTIACFGSISEQSKVPTADDQSCYFGGLAFQQHGKQWPDFPAIKFIRPALEFKLENNSLNLICHFDGKYAIDKTIALVQHLNPPIQLTNASSDIISRKNTPNKEAWTKLVNLAIKNIAQLPKVVLSRQTELICCNDVCHWNILNLWQKKNPTSFHFSFQFSKNATFIGCSPERLYLCNKGTLQTEALAGTVKRSHDKLKDAILLQSLLNDLKIHREHYFVQEFIITNLKQLSTDIQQAPAHVVQLHKIQHLCVPISAHLKKGTTNKQLLNKLHPTPAVGGFPKLAALQFIEENEPYTRGWYTGSVGYIRQEKCDFCVAIRSALILKNRIKLFAGAGIVTGSIANIEWQELNSKMSTLLSIIDNKWETNEKKTYKNKCF